MTVASQLRIDRPLLVQSFAGWRQLARTLLTRDVAPHLIQWREASSEEDLFADVQNVPLEAHEHVALSNGYLPAPDVPSVAPAPGETTLPAIRMPGKLVDMLETASCYRSPDRWAFLYRVVWRWQHGEKEVLSAADEDGNKLHAMVKAVHREEHDMHAYLRFRERQGQVSAEPGAAPEGESGSPGVATNGPRFVAWYEPAHDVLPRVARHFINRMGKVSWMIATPDATVLWDGAKLHITGPLLRGPEEFNDGGEALWLTYYRSIFNPSRLNQRLMQSHIPSRFWKNLPEGRLVPAMIADAAAGAQRVGQAETVGRRSGSVILVSEERAQPQRKAPTTLDQCRRCPLWENATQAIAGAGPENARIMLIGEQPGDQEDIAGKPFIGPAGQLLDRVLANAGLDRDTLYLTNAVKHFKWEPRGKRRLHKTPGQHEINSCRHWLEQELASVRPDVAVVMGSTALKGVLGTAQVRLTDMLNKPFRHDGRWIIVVYHPAYVLRVPDESLKQQAFDVMVQGFKQAKSLLDETSVKPWAGAMSSR